MAFRLRKGRFESVVLFSFFIGIFSNLDSEDLQITNSYPASCCSWPWSGARGRPCHRSSHQVLGENHFLKQPKIERNSLVQPTAVKEKRVKPCSRQTSEIFLATTINRDKSSTVLIYQSIKGSTFKLTIPAIETTSGWWSPRRWTPTLSPCWPQFLSPMYVAIFLSCCLFDCTNKNWHILSRLKGWGWSVEALEWLFLQLIHRLN